LKRFSKIFIKLSAKVEERHPLKQGKKKCPQVLDPNEALPPFDKSFKSIKLK